MPDTFFRNEKEGKFHDIIQPNLYVRVFPNGDVLYSIRVGPQFCTLKGLSSEMEGGVKVVSIDS